MTLWQMFSLIEYVGNKDFSGNIVIPEKFADLIKVVNIEHFRKKTGLPEEYQPGRPIPVEHTDITANNQDDIKPFKVYLPNRTVTAGIMSYPTNYAHVQTVVYNYSKTINNVATILPRQVELLREAEFASRNGNYTKRPTTMNPVGIIRNDGIHIKPATIASCDLHYLRWPVDPVFNYTIGDGFITYDASSSVEVEWPVSEHLTLVKMILSLVGINLREAELVQYAEQKLKQP